MKQRLSSEVEDQMRTEKGQRKHFLLREATHAAQSAVELDGRGVSQQAVEHYVEAGGKLLEVARLSTGSSRDTLQQKAAEYIGRAEVLKMEMQQTSAATPEAADPWGEEDPDQMACADALCIIEQPLQQPSLPSSHTLHLGSHAASRDFGRWFEATAYGVGNAGHDVRNALRFLTNAVRGLAGRSVPREFQKIDKLSGQVEGICRRVVTRAREGNLRPVMARLLPGATDRLKQIHGLLSTSGQEMDSTQRSQVAWRLAEQAAGIQHLRNALQGTAVQGGAPLLHGELDFSHTNSTTEAQLARIESSPALSAAQIVFCARIGCNAAHQCQNLAAAVTSSPSGSSQGDRVAVARKIDNLAGQVENRFRAVMVLEHSDAALTAQRGFAMHSKMKILDKCHGVLGLVELLRPLVAQVGMEGLPESLNGVKRVGLLLMRGVLPAAEEAKAPPPPYAPRAEGRGGQRGGRGAGAECRQLMYYDT